MNIEKGLRVSKEELHVINNSKIMADFIETSILTDYFAKHI